MRTNPIKLEKIRHSIYTWLLLISMAGIFTLLGWVIAGGAGSKAALLIAAVGFAFYPRLPADFVMRIYKARPIQAYELPGLYMTLRKLSVRAGLKKMPQLYYSPKPVLNAFATGTGDNAGICITRGLLQTLSNEEMTGILAHELSHIKNRDTRVMAAAGFLDRATRVTATIAVLWLMFVFPFILLSGKSVSLLSILLILSAPTLSTLFMLALSRAREFDADLGSFELTGSPYPLISALQKLERQKNRWHPFMMSVPVPRPPTILSTHPDTTVRISRLLELNSKHRQNTGRRSYMAERPMLIPIDSAH